MELNSFTHIPSQEFAMNQAGFKSTNFKFRKNPRIARLPSGGLPPSLGVFCAFKE